MRIIFLNIWGGQVFEPLMQFIQEYARSTDFFCFQEVSPELFFKISKTLPDHNGWYDIGGKYYPHNVWYAQAIFVKKGIQVSASRKTNIFHETGNKIGFMQDLSLKRNSQAIFVGNVHGNPHPGSKLDSSSRMIQSQKIIDVFENMSSPKIIGGDFNLLPDTKSIKLFEDAGYRNLIKEFNIKKTRNKLSWKIHSKDSEYFVKQYFADYVFTSSDVKVKSFEVPDIEISDHLPLILDFEV